MPRLSLFAVFRDLSWKHLASCIYYATGGIAKARLWKSKVTHYLKTARKCGLLVQWRCYNSYPKFYPLSQVTVDSVGECAHAAEERTRTPNPKANQNIDWLSSLTPK
jgi:hypothetical protein